MKKLKETIEIKLTKQEFALLTEWAKHHFWDVTGKFYDDIDADVCLDWARYCLLMARLKFIADEHGIEFGYDEPDYELDAKPYTKTNHVTEAFLQQYAANVQVCSQQMEKEASA